MRILFFLLFLIIILNNTKIYEGLDTECDKYKVDMKNNCNESCKNFNKNIEDKGTYFENNNTNITKFKDYIIKSIKKIIKEKNNCNKCMHCIIEQTSEQIKQQEKKT